MTLPRLKLPWRWKRYGIGIALVCGLYMRVATPSRETLTEFARRHGALAE